MFNRNDVYDPRENLRKLVHMPMWPHTTYLANSCGPQGNVAQISLSHGLTHDRVALKSPSYGLTHYRVAKNSVSHSQINGLAHDRMLQIVLHMSWHMTVWLKIVPHMAYHTTWHIVMCPQFLAFVFCWFLGFSLHTWFDFGSKATTRIPKPKNDN